MKQKQSRKFPIGRTRRLWTISPSRALRTGATSTPSTKIRGFWATRGCLLAKKLGGTFCGWASFLKFCARESIFVLSPHPIPTTKMTNPVCTPAHILHVLGFAVRPRTREQSLRHLLTKRFRSSGFVQGLACLTARVCSFSAADGYI